jgi:plasmid stability protein
MLQIRNVPDELHRKLKARAALAGMSMSDYALRELRKVLGRPTRAELLARLAELPSPDLEPPPAEVIRQERDSR